MDHPLRPQGAEHAPPSGGSTPSDFVATEARSQPSGRRLLIALAAALASAAVAGNAAAAVATAVAPQWSADLERLAPVVIAAVYMAVIGSLLLALGRTATQRRAALGFRAPDSRSLTLAAIAWAGAYVVAGVYYLLSGAVGADGLEDAIDLLMAVGADNGRLHEASLGLTAVILFRILVLSPVAEEMLFRGALFGWIRGRLSAPWTIAVTGITFGLIHQSPTFLPLAIAVGIAAGWIRERTGSVTVTIAAHALQSGIIVIFSLILTGWDTPPLLG